MAGQRPARKKLFAQQWEQAVAWFLPGGEIERVALKGVRRAEAFGRVVYTLAVNPDLREFRIDQELGVDANAREVGIAEQAIGARVLAEFANAETFREFIARMTPSQKRAGEFYDRLMAVKVPEEYQSKRPLKDPRKALKRAIERAGTAKRPGRQQFHLNLTKPEYIWRVQTVRRQTNIEAGALAHKAASIGVTGDWFISSDEFPFKRWNTDHSRAPSPAHDVLAAGGEGFTATVEQDYNDYVNGGRDQINVDLVNAGGVQLTKVYALHVEISDHPGMALRYQGGRIRGEASKGKRKKRQRKQGR